MAASEQLRPAPVLPMKACSDTLPTGGGWLYEVKWDGVRAIAAVDDGALHLWSGRGSSITATYPELAPLAEALHPHSAVLDGEVVALNDRGTPDFGLLQQRMHVHDPREAARRAGQVPVAYQVFDLLALDGHDLTDQPLRDRRRLLESLVEPGPCWQVSPTYDDGQALLDAATRLGLEGVVAKRADSHYLPGARSSAWRKVKIRRRQELVVAGWTDGAGNRAGHLGSLILGYYDGDALRYAGRVGSGLSMADLDRWRAELEARALDECPFDPPPPPAERRGAHWARPDLVVEVAFGEWSSDGRLRHPSYLGRRDDKDPRDVVREP